MDAQSKFEILENLYSKDRGKISVALNEILAIPNSECNKFINILMKSYKPKDNENIKITIRALNKCLYRELKLEVIEKYGDILLQNVVNNDGYTRMVVYSVMNRFRLRLLVMLSAQDSSDLKNYAVTFYSKITELYEHATEPIIKSSILSCIKTFHCFAFNEIISRTENKNTYEKFSRLLYDKRF